MKPMLRQEPQDPYSQAISGLVKKTLIIVGVFVVLGIVGVGFLLIKTSGKKTSSKAEPSASPEVLSVQQESSTPPQPSNSPIPSPTRSATSIPSASPSVTASPSTAPSMTPTIMPTTSPSSTPQSKTINADAALDGYIDGVGKFTTSGDIRVGSSTNAAIRGFLSFDITSINMPQFKSAKFRIFQSSVKNNPYTTGQDIRVDLVNYGGSLDPGDYSTASVTPSFAILSTSNSQGWKELDISQIVKQTRESGRSTLQLRLHFTIESQGDEKYASFESGENTLKTNNIPQLIVEYK